MSARRALSAEKEMECFRMWVRQTPVTEIAKRLGVHRHTVSATVQRILEEIEPEQRQELQRARAESIAQYRELIRVGWEAADKAMERGRSPAMLLAEIRQAQQRIDTLLGLAPESPDDPIVVLAQFKKTVVELITTEAPELAPRLAQRLLTAADKDHT